MGTEKRPELSGASKVPGPGSYATKSTVGDGPKAALSPRLNPLKPVAVVPGPGTYEPKHDSVVEKVPASGIGYGERGALNAKKTTNVPGPGAYTNAGGLKTGPKFGFGTSQRTNDKPSPNPGPGNYNVPSTIAALPSYEKSKSKVVT